MRQGHPLSPLWSKIVPIPASTVGGGKEMEYVQIVKEDINLSFLLNARTVMWKVFSDEPPSPKTLELVMVNGKVIGYEIRLKYESQIYNPISSWEGVFPDSSVGKESACNAGNPGSIPGLGRSAGEGIGYPLQYSQTSLVAQLVKNPPAMQESWDRSLGWEDPLEKGKSTHSSILAWRIPWTV